MNKQLKGNSERQNKGKESPAVRKNGAAEDHYKMVAEAAYYLAEQRGFATGHELDDWLCAEAEVNNRLQGTVQ